MFLFIFYKKLLLCSEIPESEIVKALNAVEGFFKDLKERHYIEVWNRLTEKSKIKIVDDVAKAFEKRGQIINKKEIYQDFSQNGYIAKAYWEGFLSYFNPDMVLIDSTWEPSKFTNSYGEIKIRYKNNENPAILKVYLENGEWKIGLTESFWIIKEKVLRGR